MHHPLLRRTTWTDIALLTRQRNAPHLAQHSHSQTQPRRASQPHRAPHPQQGTAPVMWRCTRYVALHLLRGAAPVQNGCIAYGSGAPPTPTSPNADMHTSPGAGSAPSTTATHQLDRHCATYSPTQCSASSATLPLTSLTAARVATTQGTAPLTGRYTRYVALHPIRTGALPTDRVHRPHQQAQPRRASGSPQPTPRHRPHIHQFRT